MVVVVVVVVVVAARGSARGYPAVDAHTTSNVAALRTLLWFGLVCSLLDHVLPTVIVVMGVRWHKHRGGGGCVVGVH